MALIFRTAIQLLSQRLTNARDVRQFVRLKGKQGILHQIRLYLQNVDYKGMVAALVKHRVFSRFREYRRNNDAVRVFTGKLRQRDIVRD